MSFKNKSPFDALFGFGSSVCAQLRLAVSAWLDANDDAQPGGEALTAEAGSFCGSSRSLHDYSGYLTSNGLGSLDIGGARSRFGE